jgi:hypothetical protein
MNKKLLERFINKCTLGGNVQGAKLVSSDDGLTTKFTNYPEKTVMGFLTCPNLKMGDGEFTLGDMSNFKSLLSVLNDEITLKVEQKNSKPFSFIMSDGATKATLILSNPDMVAPVPKLKAQPTPLVVFDIGPEFVTTFLRSLSALNTVQEVYFMTVNGKGQIVIGYNPERATSNVVIDPPSTVTGELKPVCFPTEYIREALVANKEMKSGKLSIDQQGVANLALVVDDFSVEYYFVRLNQ